jgi:hypothetical protein
MIKSVWLSILFTVALGAVPSLVGQANAADTEIGRVKDWRLTKNIDGMTDAVSFYATTSNETGALEMGCHQGGSIFVLFEPKTPFGAWRGVQTLSFSTRMDSEPADSRDWGYLRRPPSHGAMKTSFLSSRGYVPLVV